MGYRDAFLRGIKPIEQIDLPEWCEKYVKLSSKSSAEAGNYSVERVEYLREPMKLLSLSSPFQIVTLMKGVQLGLSTFANNLLAYYADLDPCPLLLVMPNQELVEGFSKNRFTPLLDEIPKIKDKFKAARSQAGGNTTLMKEYEGGVLYFAGGNSSAGLCSNPVRILVLDDVDRMPRNLDGEGSPIKLASARTSTFSNKKIFINSTPTDAKTSLIYKSYLEGDQRKFHVPCPHCEHFQELLIGQLKWEEDNFESVKYECIQCKNLFSEIDKINIIPRGKWIPTAKSKDPNHASFHISSMYAPIGWKSWADIARQIEAAAFDENAKISLINLEAGLPVEETGEIFDFEKIYNRREYYPQNIVPKGACLLTCGADVQHDRIELEVVAWGKNRESWSICYRTLPGDTSQAEVWDELRKVTNELFPVADSDAVLPIERMGIDCSDGNRSNFIYNFCRTHERFNQVIPVKGTSTRGTKGMCSTIDVKEKNSNGFYLGKTIKVLSVQVDKFKTEFYGNLNRRIEDGKTPIAYCHFPDYPEYYFKMLCSETYYNNHWKKTFTRNEALDCRIYARAVAYDLGIDTYSEQKWQELNDRIYAKKPKIKIEPKKRERERDPLLENWNRSLRDF